MKESSSKTIIIPGERTRYLAEIADAVRQYHQATEDQAEAVRRRWHLLSALEELGGREPDADLDMNQALTGLKLALADAREQVAPETDELIDQYQASSLAFEKDEFVYQVRDREFRVPLYTTSLSHSKNSQDRTAWVFRSRRPVPVDEKGKFCRPVPLYRRCVSVETGR